MNTFLHDAEHRTESWKIRHSPEAIAQLGAWRWKGIQDNSAMIFNLIVGKRVIDFGGFDGPLGFGSIVVDEKAELKTLDDVDGQVDVIFTSHTLEHIDNVEGWLQQAVGILRRNGYMIVHVPAWTCERWRPKKYSNPRQPNGHKWMFGLSGDYADDYPPQKAAIIDSIMACGKVGLWIEYAEYVGDNSILVIARKQ